MKMKMKMKDIFSLGLLCLLGVLVIVVMAKTPMMRSLFAIEGFRGQTISTTQCPQGYKMYMYDGTAFCCNGTVNRNAHSTEKSCLLPVTQDGVGFCTLGADLKLSTGTVPNCGNVIAENLTKQGKAICPPSKPKFCLANRCCTQTTPDGSDCANKTAGSFCDVLDPSKRFTSTTDCNYLRMKEMDTCPGNTNKGDISVTSGALSGLTIYGCSTLNTTCYTDTVLATLKAMGKDTTGLTACSGSEVPSFCSSGGKLLGKRAEAKDGLPLMSYTKEECDKLNGDFMVNTSNNGLCFAKEADIISRNKDSEISYLDFYYIFGCLSAPDKAKLPKELTTKSFKVKNGKIEHI